MLETYHLGLVKNIIQTHVKFMKSFPKNLIWIKLISYYNAPQASAVMVINITRLKFYRSINEKIIYVAFHYYG